MIYKRKNKSRKERTIALTQILILLIGIFAISWMIGGEIEEVSAFIDGPIACPTTGVGTCINSTAVCDGEKVSGGSGCKAPTSVCCVPKTATNSTTCQNTKFCDAAGKYLYGGKVGAGGGCIINTNLLLSPCANDCVNGACKALDTSKLDFNLLESASGVSALVNSANSIKGAKEILNGGNSAKNIVPKTGGSKTTTLSWLFGGDENSLGSSISGIVTWSAIAFLIGRYGGQALGLSIGNSQALGWALAGGVAAMKIVTSAEIMKIFGMTAASGPLGFLIGVVVAAVVFFIMYKNTSMDIITYTCYQWDSKSGKGLTAAQKKERCELCNSQKDLVCTEYQCRSLGQGCILVNEESSGRQLCIWDNPNDINPPLIKPWTDALLDDFKYTPDNTISPPDKGVKIAYTGTADVSLADGVKCAPPFTPVSFGVQLDEAARCKISPLNLKNYSLMADYFMGNGIRDFNHSFTLSLPSKEALEAENITVDNGGKYQLYVRCEDANGNANIGNFVFKFCISQGPDTTPPLILGTSIFDNQPVAYGQKSINIDLYVNEPSECRWSRLDKTYDTMENNMSCTTSLINANAPLTYTCKGNLTGLKDSENNKFYFRCKDQPSLKGTPKENQRNANTQSYPLTLIGTKPLLIEKVSPNATTIEDSTNVIKVNLTAETAAGYSEGKSVCSFSETGVSGSYIDFFYEYNIEPFSQYQHSQELWLGEGNYTYFIRCRDLGGNMDDKKISFSVKTDNSPPVAVRVYKEEDYLKLITNEPGKCVYSNFGCNYLFNDGTEMSSVKDKEYYAEWNINSDFYIKCEDDYGNQPPPNECSIIARPFEIFALQ